jgi:UDP-N-acetylglucosamine 2-epimerase (non-hydrolysing)
VLRTSTERQEAVEAGFAELVGVEPGRIMFSILNWWHEGAKEPNVKSPFGDGKAAERSVDILRKA